MEAPYNKNRNPKGSHSKINSRNNSNFAAVYRQEENISEKDHFFLFGNHYGSFACGMQCNGESGKSVFRSFGKQFCSA